MKYLKWTALAVCTAAAFAVGAVGAGYAYSYGMFRFAYHETTARAAVVASQRVDILKKVRGGRLDEAREILEEMLDRDIIRLSCLLKDRSFDSREKGFQSLETAARYRMEHPREGGNPEAERILREVLQRAETEP